MTAEQASRLPAERSAVVTPAEGPGYDLVDFQVPDQTAALIREAVPENTALAYRSRWRSFEAWCRDAGRVALPATAQTVAAYLTHLAVDRGLKATTAGAHLTAIRAVHRGAGVPPPDGLAARKVVVAAAKREAARDGRYGPRKAVPVMAADLPAIVAGCDGGTAAGLRDRAVILLGFALLARRSELAALNVSDIEHVLGKGLAVTIRSSKTDQSVRGVVRRIHYASAVAICPVRAVLAWLAYLAAHGITVGPLFTRIDRWGNLGAAAGGHYTLPGDRQDTQLTGRAGARHPDGGPEIRATAGAGDRRAPAGRSGRLRPQAVGDIVAAACEAAGLAAPGVRAGHAVPQATPHAARSPGERRGYSGHSLRRGGATSMLNAGAQPLNVSRHGRWADGSRAFAGYVEEATGFGDANPTKNLLLPAPSRHRRRAPATLSRERRVEEHLGGRPRRGRRGRVPVHPRRQRGPVVDHVQLPAKGLRGGRARISGQAGEQAPHPAPVVGRRLGHGLAGGLGAGADERTAPELRLGEQLALCLEHPKEPVARAGVPL
jgi:integrase